MKNVAAKKLVNQPEIVLNTWNDVVAKLETKGYKNIDITKSISDNEDPDISVEVTCEGKKSGNEFSFSFFCAAKASYYCCGSVEIGNIQEDGIENDIKHFTDEMKIIAITELLIELKGKHTNSGGHGGTRLLYCTTVDGETPLFDQALVKAGFELQLEFINTGSGNHLKHYINA